MDRPWFERETGALMLDEYVVEMESYRRIVEEIITDAELIEQTQRVTSLLQQLEETPRWRPKPSPPRRWASWRCSTHCKSDACRLPRC